MHMYTHIFVCIYNTNFGMHRHTYNESYIYTNVLIFMHDIFHVYMYMFIFSHASLFTYSNLFK